MAQVRSPAEPIPFQRVQGEAERVNECAVEMDFTACLFPVLGVKPTDGKPGLLSRPRVELQLLVWNIADPDA